jgi:LssY C-terminus
MKRSGRFVTLLIYLALPGSLLGSRPLPAQLVGEDPAPKPQQTSNATETPPAIPAAATTSVGKQLLAKDFTLDGDKIWTDTGITLEPGQHIVATAEGKLRYADAKVDNGPEGLTRGFKDLLRILPSNDAGRGALLARIGDPDIAQPFLLGAHKDAIAPVSGKLFIGINQAASDTGTGSYLVKIQILAADDTTPREIARDVASIPGVNNQLFSKIPRRIGDKDGNPGDMVNFLILGNEVEMKKVFTTAGWVKVDADVQQTVLVGVLASLSKESYLTMPMSPLYLFGRTQDYGWAHAEPITVVASRNHLRVWKAPFTVEAREVWVGAATHDIGFEKDQRNNGLTHKIDPDIDLERDFVEKTLSATGLVSEVTHFTPDHPLKEARTATGGSFHSNGQILILKLAEAPKDTSSASATK